jgi:hypothetical protein
VSVYADMGIAVDGLAGVFVPDRADVVINTDLLSRRSGTRILQDKLGVSVYREQPTPHFVGVGQPTLSVGKNSNAFIEAVDKASEVSEGLGEPILIAYYLFSASTSEQEIEARFILLVMALETMVDQQDRSALVRGHVDQLCELTKKNSNLLDEEKTSLLCKRQFHRTYRLKAA